MVVYTVHKDLLEDENPYSIWRDDVELIEDRLSYGEAVYWCLDALMGDIEAYDELVLNLVPA